MVTTINSSSFIRDITLLIRDDLLSNLTDPLGSRASKERFVMTAYPKRTVRYPIITIQNTNITTRKLGMSSSVRLVFVPLEIRVWARNVLERDGLTQDVINRLRLLEFSVGGSIGAKLFGFDVSSAVNVSEDGEQATKSKIINVEYGFILGE